MSFDTSLIIQISFKLLVQIFGKHIIRKIFPKYMDPVTSMDWVKNVSAKNYLK